MPNFFRSVVREVVGQRDLQFLLTEGRQEVEHQDVALNDARKGNCRIYSNKSCF